MKNLKAICTIAALSLSLSCAASSKTNPSEGSIIIYEKSEGHSCSIPAVPGEYYFKDDDSNSCTNDQAYHVGFENVPSALNVTFYDDGQKKDCQTSSWWMEVRTIKNPTTTSKISLDSIMNAEDNQIIQPGLIKIASRSNGQLHGKMSCVKVENDK